MAQQYETINVLCIIRNPIGGITTYMRYLYRHLDDRRYRISVLAARNPQAEKVLAALGFAQCKFVPIDGRLGLVRFAAAVVSSLLGRKVGLLHSHGATAGAVVSLINTVWQIPHVITFHETFDRNTLRGPLAPLKRHVLQYLFSRASKINVVSADARSNMLDYFPALRKVPDHIVVIQNGVDVEYLEAGASTQGDRDLRLLLGVGADKLLIGYLGRFMPEKGFPVLIEAMAQLARRGRGDMVVVAIGSGAYEREYRAKVREHELDTSIRFLEHQNDVRWVFGQLDLVAIPSLREAHPLVAIEALVLGKPIVASNCIGLREVLAGSPAVLVSPDDPAALAVGIERACRVEQRERASAYRVQARSRFDGRNSVKQLSELLERVLTAQQEK